MHRVLVLVRSLNSIAADLDFGEFGIKRVSHRFKEYRQALSSLDVNPDDWIFEKSYSHVPPNASGSAFVIRKGVEDTLLLLRLYKIGDISFTRQVIFLPDGNPNVQEPYRAMNDLNSYSALQFDIEPARQEESSRRLESIRSP